MSTSWNRVAGWYDRLVEGERSYQKNLILPNLLRIMDVRAGEKILDLACGQGFFSGEFARRGAFVTGVDSSPKLIKIAASQDIKNTHFRAGKADSLPFLKAGSFDSAVIILALQNIQDATGALGECARVLKASGRLYLVLNHPAFRIPGASGWGWDEKENIQYRRVEKYLSERRTRIQMRPGGNPSETTTSFHRPLQYYFKALGKLGFGVMGMEEWNSNRKSQPGPRSRQEDIARKEIPLFLCIIAQKTL